MKPFVICTHIADRTDFTNSVTSSFLSCIFPYTVNYQLILKQFWCPPSKWSSKPEAAGLDMILSLNNTALRCTQALTELWHCSMLCTCSCLTSRNVLCYIQVTNGCQTVTQVAILCNLTSYSTVDYFCYGQQIWNIKIAHPFHNTTVAPNRKHSMHRWCACKLWPWKHPHDMHLNTLSTLYVHVLLIFRLFPDSFANEAWYSSQQWHSMFKITNFTLTSISAISICFDRLDILPRWLPLIETWLRSGAKIYFVIWYW